MLKDINESPGAVFCLQEATPTVCEKLRNGLDTPDDDQIRLGGKRQPAKSTPESDQKWLVVAGVDAYDVGEFQTTTAVAVRNSVFKCVMRNAFLLQYCGEHKTPENIRKPSYNRLMFCTLKFRRNNFYEGNNPDEIGIANAHLHWGCAKKDNIGKTTPSTTLISGTS